MTIANPGQLTGHQYLGHFEMEGGVIVSDPTDFEDHGEVGLPKGGWHVWRSARGFLMLADAALPLGGPISLEFAGVVFARSGKLMIDAAGLWQAPPPRDGIFPGGCVLATPPGDYALSRVRCANDAIGLLLSLDDDAELDPALLLQLSNLRPMGLAPDEDAEENDAEPAPAIPLASEVAPEPEPPLPVPDARGVLRVTTLHFGRTFSGEHALRLEGRERLAAASALRERFLGAGKSVSLKGLSWRVDFVPKDAAAWKQRQSRFTIHTTRQLAEELARVWSASDSEPVPLQHLPGVIA